MCPISHNNHQTWLFSYTYGWVDVVGLFCNEFDNNDTSQKDTYLQIVQFFHLFALHT
jgi:hypothetical protein